jgi:DNA repair protein RadC
MKDLISEIEVTYTSKIKSSDRLKITCSEDANQALRTFWPSFEHVEYVYLLLLNRQNQLIGKYFLAKGGMAGTIVDIRVVFQVALKANASAIMIAHNHPSGNLLASEADRKITQQLKEAGNILEIPLLDHIILTEEGYLSLADDGYL